MTEMLEDNPLDKFFRDSIESAEAKPSEQFWNKAYESIIVREGRANRKRILAWRSAAILLAFMMTGLISYNLYISDKVNGLRNEVKNVEKFQSNSTPVKALNTNNPVSAASNIPAGNTNSSEAVKNSPSLSDAMPAAPAEASRFNGTKAAGFAVHPNGNSASPTVIEHQSNPHTNKLVSFVNNNASSTLTGTNSSTPTAAAGHVTKDNINTLATVNGRFNAFKALFNPVTTSLLPYLNATYPEATKSSESMMPDSALMNEPNPAEKVKSYFVDVMIPKFSVSGFYSINNYLYSMHGSNPVENINASQMVANEHKESAFSSGISIGYDLSPRFTVQAGCNYQQYQFAIASTPLNVGGDYIARYPLETSSGIITLPLLPGWSNSNGATATAQGDAIRSYICAPVQLKWNFVEDKKLKLYVTGGGAISILDINRATIGWENSFGTNTTTVSDIGGTNHITFSYLAGIGAEYKLTKGFSAYIEGTYLGALMPVSSDSYINVKSNLLSETVGINYHL